MAENTVEVRGASPENAILLLAAAEELKLDPGVVQTTSNNSFVVPDKVAEKAGFDENGVAKSKAAKKAADEAGERPGQEQYKDTSNPVQSQAELDQRKADAEAAAADKPVSTEGVVPHSAEAQQPDTNEKVAARNAAEQASTDKNAPETPSAKNVSTKSKGK